MAQNYVNSGDKIEFVASGAIVSGDAILIGDTVGVCLGKGVSGDTIQVAIAGAFTLPKATGAAISQGAIVYWDNSAKKIAATSASGANKAAGIALKAELSAATTVIVKLTN